MKTITIQVTRADHYAGVKLQFPATGNEIDEFCRQLDRISADASTTQIKEASSNVEYLSRYIKQFLHADNRADLTALNALARTLIGMSEDERYKFSCTLNPHMIHSFNDVLHLLKTQGSYIVLKGICEYADFGRYLVDNGLVTFPEQVKPYLDYALVEHHFSHKYGGGLGPYSVPFTQRGYAVPKQALEMLKAKPIQIMGSPSTWDAGAAEKNCGLADHDNRVRGITGAQKESMLCGSTCGWNRLGADLTTQQMKEKAEGTFSQPIENAFLEEACRQWYAFILEDNDRMDGVGFAHFYREIREQIIGDPDFMENFKAQDEGAQQMGGMQFE